MTVLTLLTLALFVAFWRARRPRPRATPQVAPRVSRDELNLCAGIARRRIEELSR